MTGKEPLTPALSPWAGRGRVFWTEADVERLVESPVRLEGAPQPGPLPVGGARGSFGSESAGGTTIQSAPGGPIRRGRTHPLVADQNRRGEQEEAAGGNG